VPKQCGFGLEVDVFGGGDYGPDRDGAVSAGRDEGFGVGEECAGELGLVDVFE